MTYWRKDTDADEFIGIAELALGNMTDNKCLKDKMVYTSYTNPMNFLRYRKKVLGFSSQVKQWKSNIAKNTGEPATHYARDNFDIETEKGLAEWRDYYLIEKVNQFLNSHLRWQNGQSGKQQFNHAKDIYYYFKKEENYQ